MTHDEAIKRVELIKRLDNLRFTVRVTSGEQPSMSREDRDALDEAVILLRGSGVSSMRKDDQGAALLPADPPASPASSEALPNTGIPRIPNVWENATVYARRPCVMDYPTAWAFIREQHPDPKEHDPRCSWVQTSGGILCDCHVINDEYARRKASR